MKKWTIQIVPERGGSTRSLQLPGWLLQLAGAGLAVVLCAFAVWLFVLSTDTRQAVELTELRSENRRLRSDLQAIERRTHTLGRALDRLSAREERFRLLAGLPLIDPDVRQVGVGGPETAAPPAPSDRLSGELDRLLRRAELLSSSISEATDSVRVNRDRFLSQPSIRPVPSDDAWISSSYSRSRYHPILLHNRPHEGIDISAHHGSPILASARGKVTFAGWMPGYGKLVEVDHGYGYRTRYAHAARVLVRKGESVHRGDKIAEVGNTGLTTGPNLHYEVLINGRPVDPRPFFLNERLFE